MNVDGRRDFLQRSGAVLDGVATASGDAAASPRGVAASRSSAGTAVVGCSMEFTNFNGNGADLYFEVKNNMVLNSINIDVAFMIGTSSPQNEIAEVLCTAGVSRGAVPTFNNTGGHAYFNSPSSPNFGAITVYNPNGLNISANTTLAQDVFYAVILRVWIPSGGAASSPSRQVLANSSISLNAGDYLVFHMDHFGSIGDGEMIAILQYTRR